MTRIISYRIVSVDISASFLEHCHEIMVPTPYLDQSSNNRQVVIVVQATATSAAQQYSASQKRDAQPQVRARSRRSNIGRRSIIGRPERLPNRGLLPLIAVP